MPFEEDIFLGAVRDKVDFTRLLLYALKALLLDIVYEGIDTNSSFKIAIAKMSRLFVYKDGKFFSVSFPFNLIISGENIISITTHSGNDVTSQTVSSAISIL